MTNKKALIKRYCVLIFIWISLTGMLSAQYWELSYHFQFWNNDAPNLDISFKAKSNQPTKLPVRLICNPWAWGGGDVFQWEVPINEQVQTYQTNASNAIHYLGTTYQSTRIPPFEWPEGMAYDGYRGRMSLHGSFLDDAVTQPGTKIWLDDVVIKEAGLTLEKFDVDYAPSSLEVNQTDQFKIGEFVFPTHAPIEVNFTVENGTGEASIDQHGVLTGLQEGEVIVYIDTPNKTDEKKFTVVITDSHTGLQDVNLSVITLSTTMIEQGSNIYIHAPIVFHYSIVDMNGVQRIIHSTDNYIRTDMLSPGIYFVLIQTENGQQTTRKFIVK